MIYLLFHEINYLLFNRIFICYLILVEIIGFSRYNVQCLYLLFLILQLRNSYCAYLQTQVEIDIARFFDDDRRNLDMLHMLIYILIHHILIKRYTNKVFVKYNTHLPFSSSVEYSHLQL